MIVVSYFCNKNFVHLVKKKKEIAVTLEYLIAEHARLTILNIFSTLLTLNRSCLLNYFEDFIHPAHLLGTAHFIFQGNLEF